MTELFPEQNKFPSLSPEDEVTHVADELTKDLQYSAPSIPIPQLVEKQTAALNQLEAIFNMAVPQEPSTPTDKLLRV